MRDLYSSWNTYDIHLSEVILALRSYQCNLLRIVLNTEGFCLRGKKKTLMWSSGL